MIRSLFRKAKSNSVRLPHVPEDVRAYAIGDIHGRADLFDDILAQIEADHIRRPAKRRVTILLGDLIDRGPDSAGVIDRALALERADHETHILTGNHEELLLLAFNGDREALRLFTRVGGRETLASYGIDGDEYNRADYDELLTLLHARIPPGHIELLRRMEDIVELGDYAFVHAGIRPGVAMNEQRPQHLRWIRSEFLDFRDPHPRFIVHGHTISEDIDERQNRVGIDTGAYVTGRLTAIGLEGADRWYLTTD